MTLREVAMRAMEILADHSESAYYDAGFDAGEYSEPAHAKQADEEIAVLAEANGFTFEAVMRELSKADEEGA